MNPSLSITFIGGGHMAAALIGGLRAGGWAAAQLQVVEPQPAQRERLQAQFGVRTLAAPDASLAEAGLVVWAVKPQVFAEAAAPCRAWVGAALHLSVMAGLRTQALCHATGSERIVRAMPNTPALIGQGISGLYARPAVDAAARDLVQTVLAPTGTVLWVDQEADLDAVTALSGSGPAYVFLFLEALVDAAQRMGLSAEQGRQLALATFGGATELARRSPAPLAELRASVTSKGGTTQAALQVMAAQAVDTGIVQAVLAARDRARELGDAFAP